MGGIEHWLRLLCEHLVALKGWDVEVFTTCAVSAATWADELPPGDSELERRHRAPPSLGLGTRPPLGRAERLDPDTVPLSFPTTLAHRFVELVGPVCPDVLDDAAESDCDLDRGDAVSVLAGGPWRCRAWAGG